MPIKRDNSRKRAEGADRSENICMEILCRMMHVKMSVKRRYFYDRRYIQENIRELFVKELCLKS